jgi:hypothetical protein
MKPILVKMVQRQLEKWPGKHFNPSKTKVEDLKRHLLGNAGFTKEVQATEDAEGGDREEQQQEEEGEVSPHHSFCWCHSVLMPCPSEEPWS